MFWNINGWGKYSTKNEIKEQFIRHLNLGIIAAADTHLVVDNKININDFDWFGQNRRNFHRNARCGSGGVGVLVKKELFKKFNIDILDSTFEGIIWLKFECKQTRFCFSTCACYLPSETSIYVCNPSFTHLRLKFMNIRGMASFILLAILSLDVAMFKITLKAWMK